MMLIPFTNAVSSDEDCKTLWIAPKHVVAIYRIPDGATGMLTVAGVLYHVKETPDQIDRIWPQSN